MAEVFRVADRRHLVRPRQAARRQGPTKAGQARPLDHPPQPPARVPPAARAPWSWATGRARYGDLFGYVVFIGGGNSAVPADARALARLHLKEIADRIGKVLETRTRQLDDTTRAHLEECQHRIAKVLEANLDINEP